ncbi:MAG: YqcC family protein [Gammaproteobacteria bacterium]
MMKQQYRQMQALMRQAEAEMRRAGLWSDMPPSATAMQSIMPFMYDTLRFHEWLQWVFLPRTQALMDAGRALPANCHIHPLAEHELGKLEVETGTLLAIVLAIDNTLNQTEGNTPE